MGRLQGLFALLLWILESLLSTLLTSSDSSGSPRRDSPDDDGTGKPDQRDEDPHSKLAKAFHLFGSSVDEARKSPVEVREKIRKSFRKLSLLHHPDRNSGSQDAVEKMQQINCDYELCCSHLDKLEGIQDEHEPEPEPEEAKHQEPEWSEPPQSQSSGRRRRRKNRKKKGRQWEPDLSEAERSFRRQKSEVRAEISRLDREEKARKKAEKQSWKKRQRKNRGYKQSPQDMVSFVSEADRRRMSHTEWVDACEEQLLQHDIDSSESSSSSDHPPFPQSPSSVSSMDDIDGDDGADEVPPEQETERKTETDGAEESRCQKPKHQTLESCSDEIAVAVRLGHTAVVFDLLEDRAMKILAKKTVDELRRSYRDPEDMTPMDFLRKMDPENLLEAWTEACTLALDDDGNTLLHYVCYYEASDILSVVLMHVGSCYEDLVLMENSRGQIPADFCQVAKDQAFKERIDVTMETARKAREDRKIENRLAKIASKIDIMRAFYSVCGCLVGQWLFGHGRIMSFIIFCIASKIGGHASVTGTEKPADSDHQIIFLCNIVWWAIRSWTVFLFNALNWWVCIGAAVGLCFVGPYHLWRAAFSVHVQLGLLPARVLNSVFDRTGVRERLVRLAGSNVALRDLVFLAIYSLSVWGVRQLVYPVLAALIARFMPVFVTLSTDNVNEVLPVDANAVDINEMSPMENAKHLFERTLLDEEGEAVFVPPSTDNVNDVLVNEPVDANALVIDEMSPMEKAKRLFEQTFLEEEGNEL